MKIEITKNNPPVISWCDKTGWVKRVKVTRKSLKECGFNHCTICLVLLLLTDILCKKNERKYLK